MADIKHPGFARAYLWLAARADRRGGAEHRQRLVAGLTGTVLEVGAGGGSNFRFYPPTVTAVTAVEPEPSLRAQAELAARAAPVPVTVIAGTAEQLPLADGSVDNVVLSLVLCSVDDQAVALGEIRRVLRPGGQLRFYEHVRASRPWAGRAEDLITPVWRRLAGNCHPNRDTEAAITMSGFTLSDVDRFDFAPAPVLPPTAHVIGTAQR